MALSVMCSELVRDLDYAPMQLLRGVKFSTGRQAWKASCRRSVSALHTLSYMTPLRSQVSQRHVYFRAQVKLKYFLAPLCLCPQSLSLTVGQTTDSWLPVSHSSMQEKRRARPSLTLG